MMTYAFLQLEAISDAIGADGMLHEAIGSEVNGCIIATI
jgi:hypothetical protein